MIGTLGQTEANTLGHHLPGVARGSFRSTVAGRTPVHQMKLIGQGIGSHKGIIKLMGNINGTKTLSFPTRMGQEIRGPLEKDGPSFLTLKVTTEVGSTLAIPNEVTRGKFHA